MFVRSVLFVRAELVRARADVHALSARRDAWQEHEGTKKVSLVVAVPHPVSDVPVRHHDGPGTVLNGQNTIRRGSPMEALPP